MRATLAEIDILKAFGDAAAENDPLFTGTRAAEGSSTDGDILQEVIDRPDVERIELFDAFSSDAFLTTNNDLVIEAPGSANTAGLAIEMIGAAAMLSADSANGFTLLGRDDGNDTITGGRGDDMIEGRGGADTLNGGAGADILDGGEGNDWINVNGDEALGDVIDGGSGTDQIVNVGPGSLIFTRLNDGEMVRDIEQLDLGINQNPLLGTEDGDIFDLSEINFINGSIDRDADAVHVSTFGGNDIVFGAQQDNLSYDLGGGDDTFTGTGNRRDTVDGGDGEDILNGGGGNDVLEGGAGADQLFGDGGNDFFVVSG